MSLPGLPGLPDWFDDIGDLIGKARDEAIDFLWKPLKPWFQGIYDLQHSFTTTIQRIEKGIADFSRAVGELFDNGPAFIAHWLILGFRLWFDPLVDLVEDALDEALE